MVISNFVSFGMIFSGTSPDNSMPVDTKAVLTMLEKLKFPWLGPDYLPDDFCE